MSARSWKYGSWIRDAVLLIVVVFAIRAYQQRDLPRGPAPAIGGIALDGKLGALEPHRGRPVLLYFWATWCGVCRVEQSSIDAISRELPVLTVASRSGDRSAVAAYVEKHGVASRVLVDSSGEIAKRYGIHAFPTTFVLDGDGEIRFREVGYTTEVGLRARLWLASF